MFNIPLKRQWFYALAAIVLLLQSFAVWHDAEHAFHAAEAQCERLNAINHLPAVDILPELAISLQSEYSVDQTPLYTFALPVLPREQHAIRAPPVLS
ncbi:hypothetical protein [uncultured Methylophaga sp.]|uniref:hypothetical protein n=1 Tax=uncultured Methylophaga sp. TaxID=285271 RepID=UPI00260EE672|nr:hypothetical protein [uncultured Methylophaga sp.]